MNSGTDRPDGVSVAQQQSGDVAIAVQNDKELESIDIEVCHECLSHGMAKVIFIV